jgi:hypothetical protein
LIDFKPRIVNQKLMAYYKSLEDKTLHNKSDEVPIFTEYDLADLISQINHNFEDDVEKHGCIRSIIDYQFEKKTHKFFRLEGFFFVLMCVVPFTLGLMI